MTPYPVLPGLRAGALLLALLGTPFAAQAAATPATPNLPNRIESRLESFRQALELRPDQQALFARAHDNTARALPELRAGQRAFHTLTRQTLEQERPDLVALARERDRYEDGRRAMRQKLRQDWLDFYASLDSAQVAIVKKHMSAFLTRAEGLRQALSPFAAGEL